MIVQNSGQWLWKKIYLLCCDIAVFWDSLLFMRTCIPNTFRLIWTLRLTANPICYSICLWMPGDLWFLLNSRISDRLTCRRSWILRHWYWLGWLGSTLLSGRILTLGWWCLWLAIRKLCNSIWRTSACTLSTLGTPFFRFLLCVHSKSCRKPCQKTVGRHCKYWPANWSSGCSIWFVVWTIWLSDFLFAQCSALEFPCGFCKKKE